MLAQDYPLNKSKVDSPDGIPSGIRNNFLMAVDLQMGFDDDVIIADIFSNRGGQRCGILFVRQKKGISMPNESHDRLSSWAQFLNALSNFGTKIIWTAIGIIVVAAVGRNFYFKSKESAGPPAVTKTEVAIVEPIPWHEVDQEIVAVLQAAHHVAESHAQTRLDEWTAELQQRIDDDFLNWYFSYWQQQWMGLKAMGYWLADRAIVEKVIGEQASMSERMTQEIQEEFSKRVLRPQIAQLQIERIADATVQIYIKEVNKNLVGIPEKYNIPQADWERHLDNIALLTADIEGNREISLTLKAVTVSGVAGGSIAAVKVVNMLKPRIARIGTRMTTKAATKGAGKAAAKVASKTGAKVGAKVGGKFLGAIIGVGVLIWDVWDHQHTKKVERPILRENLADYLSELEHSLLYEPETGLMTVVGQLEATIVSSLKTEKSDG